MTLSSVLPEAASAVATNVLYNACMGAARTFSDSPAIHQIWLNACVRLPSFAAEVANIAAISVANAAAYTHAVVKAVMVFFLTLTSAAVIPQSLYPRSLASLPAPPPGQLTSHQLTGHISRFPSPVGVATNAVQTGNRTASTSRASTSTSFAPPRASQPITMAQKEEAHASKVRIGYPSLQTWEYAISKKPNWDKMCKNTFKPDHMRACANCGVTAIYPTANFVARTLKHWPRGKKAPATLAYPHLLLSMTVEPGQPISIDSKFWTCQICSKTGDDGKISDKGLARAKYVVPEPTPYKTAILNQDPLTMQLMSIVDTTLQFCKRMNAFATGSVSNISSLCGPLIHYASNSRVHLRNATDELFQILGIMKLCNPLVQRFATMLERENPTNGIPILTNEDTQSITEKEEQRDPRGVDESRPRHMGLAFQMPMGSTMLPIRSNAYVRRAEYTEHVGSVQRRGNTSAGSALLRDGSSGAIDAQTATASVYAPEMIPAQLQENFTTQTVSQLNISVPRVPPPPSQNPGVANTGPLAVDESRLESIDVVASQRNPEAPLPFVRTSLQQSINLEMCLFPHCFPHGTGSYDGNNDGNNYSLLRYTEHRLKTAFCIFTLYQPWVLLMYQIHQCHSMASKYSCQALERDLANYKKRFPDAPEDEIYESVAKCKVPGEFAGSPTWYRSALKDLQCMVENYGMPDLFLTLTADEVSPTRFYEVSNIENFFLKKWLDPDTPHLYTYAPVENARMFHQRCSTFLSDHICCKDADGNAVPGLLGKVNHYVRRYECQNRGSLHAHIMLWLEPESRAVVESEITASIPGIVRPGCEHLPPQDYSRYEKPATPIEDDLLYTICRKQMHTCRPTACCESGSCNQGFPVSVHPSRKATQNETSGKWSYHRPSEDCANVVPYHPAVAALWGGHTNCQLVCNSALSYYLLKYTMKAERTGALSWSESCAINLGLPGLSAPQRKLMSGLILTKPVYPCDAALTLLSIPVVETSVKVTFINSSRPGTKMVPLSSSARRSNVSSTFEKYGARPACLEDLTFTDYYKQFSLERNLPEKLKGSNILKDDLNWYLLPRQGLVRFNDPHPMHATEDFFFNLLLTKKHFRSIDELLEGNVESYYQQAVLDGHIPAGNASEVLEELVDAYMSRNMWDQANSTAVLDTLLNRMADFEQQGGNAGPEADAGDLVTFNEATPESIEAARKRTEFEDVARAGCLPHQQRIYDSIFNKRAGIVALSGAGGAGKSHILKCLTHNFRQAGRIVSITATTARAARNLSIFGRTIHSAFGLEVNALRNLRVWAPFSKDNTLIRETDVYLVDEMSMLTQDQLYYVLLRIRSACGYKDMDELLQKKLIILTGDLFQLPPVCVHKVDNDDGSTICKKCHLTSSIFWDRTEKFDIEGSVRHHADPAFAQFCSTIRKQEPAQSEIDSALSGCKRISKDDVALQAAPTPGAGAEATDLSTILCTHNDDVNKYNRAVINRLYGPQVLRVPIDFFEGKTRQPLNTAPPSIKAFLDKKDFHRLTHVAIGAPVILTTNTNTASNGDSGVVVDLHMQDGDHLQKISVKLDSGEVIVFRHTVSDSFIFNQVKYTKFTFPLILGYAMTAHKAQGLTIPRPVIINADGAFEAGQMYVLFSRVTQASLLTICGTLSPEIFKPVKIPGLNC